MITAVLSQEYRQLSSHGVDHASLHRYRTIFLTYLYYNLITLSQTRTFRFVAILPVLYFAYGDLMTDIRFPLEKNTVYQMSLNIFEITPMITAHTREKLSSFNPAKTVTKRIENPQNTLPSRGLYSSHRQHRQNSHKLSNSAV